LRVSDLGEAEIPFDFVVGGDAEFGEEAAEGQAGSGLLVRGAVDSGDRGYGAAAGVVVLSSGIAFSINN